MSPWHVALHNLMPPPLPQRPIAEAILDHPNAPRATLEQIAQEMGEILVMLKAGPMTTTAVANAMGMSSKVAATRLRRLVYIGEVKRTKLTGCSGRRGTDVWKAVHR